MEKEYNKELEKDYHELLKLIGNFIKRERESLGYTSAEKFGNKIDILKSQMNDYENGTSGMTIKTFHRIFRGLNKNHGDIFQDIITKQEAEQSFEDFSLSNSQKLQVKTQVEIATNQETADQLSPHDINRLYLMLSYCHNKRLKKSEITSKFNLLYATKNFNKLLEIAKNANWINMTYPSNKNHKEQTYFTTETGKRVLNLSKE